MLYSGRLVGAEEALRIGLVHHVVADAELAEAACDLAETIAATPGAAATKRSILASQPAIFDAG